MFLTQQEIDLLTGIRKGRTEGSTKLTKFQRQADFLRVNAIPFLINAAGRPVIARAAVEGRKEPLVTNTAWQSNAR